MTLRAKVFARDRGICRLCKRDTELLIETAMREDSCTRQQAIKALGEYLGGGWSVKSLWQADHRTPRAMGGSDALENLQTLCITCHKRKTAQRDIKAIAKSCRLRKASELHKAKMDAKAGRHDD